MRSWPNSLGTTATVTAAFYPAPVRKAESQGRTIMPCSVKYHATGLHLAGRWFESLSRYLLSWTW